MGGVLVDEVGLLPLFHQDIGVKEFSPHRPGVGLRRRRPLRPEGRAPVSPVRGGAGRPGCGPRRGDGAGGFPHSAGAAAAPLSAVSGTGRDSNRGRAKSWRGSPPVGSRGPAA